MGWKLGNKKMVNYSWADIFFLLKENFHVDQKESCGPLLLFFFSFVEKKQKNRHLTRVCLNSTGKIERKPSRALTLARLGFVVFFRTRPPQIFPAEFLTANPLRLALSIKLSAARNKLFPDGNE